MANLTRSYVHGASETALLGLTVGQALDRAAEQWPDVDAVVVRHQGIRWTWRELRERSDTLAANLLALGLEPGDRIGIWSPNSSEWALTQFAAARAGLILVNLNPAYRLSETEYALTKVECRALVTVRRFKSSDYCSMLRELAPELDSCAPGKLESKRLPALRHVIAIGGEVPAGMLAFEALTRASTDTGRSELARVTDQLQFDDPINIQFTSGTTGYPKGATLTHHNIVNNGLFVGEGQRLTERDRVCIPVPLYHCFGMVLGNMACVTHGSTMVYPSEGFDPRAVLEAVQVERCTALYGVPTMFIAVLDHPDRASFDVGTLRTGIMAGSPCPIEVMKRVVSELHMNEVTICYGMTETSPVSFQTTPDDPLDRRVSTVGRIHPHVEVRIVDGENRTLAPGSVGELCTRGYCVMLGYWGDDARTHEAIDAAGWMHTGDLATIDVEGYCKIVGRIKDMVIRGGENIYPREVEEFLYRHPNIQDVQVIGVPDEKFGEELCAWIKLREGATLTADAVRAFCREQIAHNKIPRYVRFVDSFPMTVTGKVQKYLMRDQMRAELGLKEIETA